MQQRLSTLEILDNMERYIDKAIRDTEAAITQATETSRMLLFLKEDIYKARADVLTVVSAGTRAEEEEAIRTLGDA